MINIMKVNRTKTIKQLLDELEYKQYINEDVLKTIKNEGDKDVKVEFFNLGKYTSNAKVLKEYEKRNLTQDLGAVITYLIENPKTLDEKKYIGVQMKDDVFVIFLCWYDEREVRVYRSVSGWDAGTWFGGVKKQIVTQNGNGEDLKTKILENKEIDLNTCFNWKGAKRDGYGLIKINKKQTSVHRIIYELLVAPIPKGYVIDHLCRNVSCINPAHLQPVTIQENTLRGESFAALNSKKTHCPKGHLYSGDNLSRSNKNYRRCKQCNRERMRK